MYVPPRKFNRIFPKGDLIGKGTYGSVFKSGDHVVKEGTDVKSYLSEISTYLLISHDNIAKLEAWSFNKINDQLSLALEIGIPIYDGKISFSTHRFNIFEIKDDLCNAVYALHSLEIVHGDIKPENIIYQNGKFKLIDFGLMKYSRNGKYRGTQASFGYVDPEYTIGDWNPIQSELYSIAVTIYDYFSYQNRKKKNKNQSLYRFRTGDSDLDKLIKDLIHYPVDERKSIAEICEIHKINITDPIVNNPEIKKSDPNCISSPPDDILVFFTNLEKDDVQMTAETLFLSLEIARKLDNYSSKGFSNAIDLAAIVGDDGKSFYKTYDVIDDFIKLGGVIDIPTFWHGSKSPEDLGKRLHKALLCEKVPDNFLKGYNTSLHHTLLAYFGFNKLEESISRMDDQQNSNIPLDIINYFNENKNKENKNNLIYYYFLHYRDHLHRLHHKNAQEIFFFLNSSPVGRQILEKIIDYDPNSVSNFHLENPFNLNKTEAYQLEEYYQLINEI